MPVACSAYGCTKRRRPGEQLQFFGFPIKNPDLNRLWINAVRRDKFIPTSFSKLCGDHFIESDYLDRPGTYVKHLKADAVPSVFPAFSSHYQTKEKKIRNPRKKIMLIINEESEIKLLNEESEIKLFNEESEIKLFNQESKIKLFNEESKIKLLNESEIKLFNEEDIPTSNQAASTYLPANVDEKSTILSVEKLKKIDEAVQTEESTLPTTVRTLRKKIKVLQQKLRRKTATINNLRDLLKT